MLKPGDIVEVLNPAEIMKTLDSNGTLENLPFMPEMIQHCGKKFKIKARIEDTCAVGINDENKRVDSLRAFKFNDVVSLDELRCDGSAHGGCQASCTIYWKNAWLKKSDKNNEPNTIKPEDINKLIKILKTKCDNGNYFCQSTNLYLATINITKAKKLFNLLRKTWSGEKSIFETIKSILDPIIRKIVNFKGTLKKTKSDFLNLQPGEIIKVKTFDEILKTLDEYGNNKGLGFHQGMREYCDKKFKVRSRLEQLIDEATGEMIKINSTVFLEDVVCKKCPRASFHYWREIWLKRIIT